MSSSTSLPTEASRDTMSWASCFALLGCPWWGGAGVRSAWFFLVVARWWRLGVRRVHDRENNFRLPASRRIGPGNHGNESLGCTFLHVYRARSPSLVCSVLCVVTRAGSFKISGGRHVPKYARCFIRRAK